MRCAWARRHPTARDGTRSAVRYKVFMHIVIDAPSDDQALNQAIKLNGLLRHPMVRMAIKDEGVQLADGDGQPLVYHPQRK